MHRMFCTIRVICGSPMLISTFSHAAEGTSGTIPAPQPQRRRRRRPVYTPPALRVPRRPSFPPLALSLGSRFSLFQSVHPDEFLFPRDSVSQRRLPPLRLLATAAEQSSRQSGAEQIGYRRPVARVTDWLGVAHPPRRRLRLVHDREKKTCSSNTTAHQLAAVALG
jgi:hypothetical protein